MIKPIIENEMKNIFILLMNQLYSLAKREQKNH